MPGSQVEIRSNLSQEILMTGVSLQTGKKERGKKRRNSTVS
jgi:hypothetical protein